MSPLLGVETFNRPLPAANPPGDEAEYVHNVKYVANDLGVESKALNQALGYLEALLEKEQSADDVDRCEALVRYSDNLMAPLAASSTGLDIIRPTHFLLRILNRLDLELAEEGVETAELGLLIARKVDELTGAQTDLLAEASVGHNHDIGKTMVDPEINQISKEGVVWGPEHMEANKLHSLWGFVMTLAAGLPGQIARPTYAMHAKQTGDIYGIEVNLFPGERPIRDSATVADTTVAMLTRTNTRNRYLSLEERLQRVRNNIGWVYGDYDYVSTANNPVTIAQEVFGLACGFVASRYEFRTASDGSLIARRIGGLCLAEQTQVTDDA